MRLLTVSIDARWPERIEKEGRAHSVGDALLWDQGGEVSRRYRIDAVPTVVVIDPGGIIRYRHRGHPGTSQLVEEVRAALRPRDQPGAQVCLTFDDFPQPHFTEQILDALARQGVSATFFAIGRNAERHPGLVRRAAREGHVLGNHSYSHRKLDGMNEEELRREIARANRVLESLTGQIPKWFRPPGESRHARLEGVVRDLGMSVHRATIDPYDTSRPGGTAIVERVMAQLKPRATVMLHCGVRDTAQALPLLLKCLRYRGYVPTPKAATIRDTPPHKLPSR